MSWKLIILSDCSFFQFNLFLFDDDPNFLEKIRENNFPEKGKKKENEKKTNIRICEFVELGLGERREGRFGMRDSVRWFVSWIALRVFLWWLISYAMLRWTCLGHVVDLYWRGNGFLFLCVASFVN